MSFSVSAQQNDGFEQIILEDKDAHSQVSILPQFGASLHAFIIDTEYGLFNVIDNYKDIETLQKELGLSYKSAKLSPFACRVTGGRYTYKAQQFEFRDKFSDGSSIHGLLYNKPFNVLSDFCDDTQASVQLKYNYKKEDPGYPFKYRCEVWYTLLPYHLLQVQTTIFNLDKEVIPLADGWHPYFRLGGKANDWLLRFHAESMVEFDKGLIPTGQLLSYEKFKEGKAIAETELDNCFLLNKEKEFAACFLLNPAIRYQ